MAENYFPETIIRSNTIIITCTGKREAQFITKIPLFPEVLSLKDFVLFNFHDYFDGIICIRDLRKLKLNIDFKNKVFFNDKIKIPLHYRQDFLAQKIKILPNS